VYDVIHQAFTKTREILFETTGSGGEMKAEVVKSREDMVGESEGERKRTSRRLS